MAEINLTQAEADALLKMEKFSVDNTEHKLPHLGGKISVPLTSLDKRETFLLDISRGKIDLLKQTYQTRAHTTIVLARFDTGPPHRNPPELGGKEVGVPHIHIYKEGFADKYATDKLDGIFSDLNDPQKVLHDFMKYCNIIQSPIFSMELSK
ncbi:MAG: DUF6978 family protein [Candidatus Halichondribacter symbioticus]